MDERARTMSRQPIAAPDPPEGAALDALIAAFRNEPRIAEAWLTGSRITPGDGAPAYEQTDIGLVLDPPFEDGGGYDGTMFVHRLREAAPGCDVRGWLFVSETQIRAHGEHATLLYSR